MKLSSANPRAMPGPGDLGSPRGSDSYGPCIICEQETSDNPTIDHDEDGPSVTFTCLDCDDLIREMENDPEEVARNYRKFELALERIHRITRPHGRHA